MKILTVIGARPQFIKASMISRAIINHNIENRSSEIVEEIIHTGQHFDHDMSQVFFNEMEIPEPVVNLQINSGSHGEMTGQMLQSIEKEIIKRKPDWLLVYGDTNSTLAAALAASKLHVPVAHVESGLRSFNKNMPEEINRILTDHVSTLLFCPTTTAIKNLKNEGITKGVHNVGDVMYDIAIHYKEKAMKQFSLDCWNLLEKDYVLCTVHRAENTDNSAKLTGIFTALQEIAKEVTVLLPLHPRTKKTLEKIKKEHLLDHLQVTKPLSFLEMIRLEISAKVILTDSGGVQKEAFFHKTPCLTLREETEWVETVELAWNHICGSDTEKILIEWNRLGKQKENSSIQPFGNGKAAHKILELFHNFHS